MDMQMFNFYFWRAYLKVGNALRYIDSLINFTSIEDAETDWRVNGEIVIHGRGYGKCDIRTVSVVEQYHA